MEDEVTANKIGYSLEGLPVAGRKSEKPCRNI
jgi:hypothetical protein